MANWSILKASVAEAIKTNENQEITGQILQNTLNSIISNLGENATFAGIAKPTTNPGAPDGPVFYLAFQAGTYSNFSGAKINNIDNVKIFKYDSDSTWAIIDTGLPNNSKVTQLVTEISDKLLSDVNAITQKLEDSVNQTVEELSNKVDNQKNEVNAARDKAIEAINAEEQNAIINFNAQRVTPEMLSESTLQLINSSGGGTVTNMADDEDLYSTGEEISVLKFKDKDYVPKNFNGLGRVFLRKNIQLNKNILTQNMINKSNTRYIIQYDYDLNGATINIPEDCILDFQGGSLKNGVLTGNNTIISSNPILIFDDITFLGTYNLDNIYIEWFCTNKSDVTTAVQTAIDFASANNGAIIRLLNKSYPITDTIYIKAKVSIIGCRPQGRNTDKSSVFDCKFEDPNKWAIDCKYTDDELADFNDIFCSNFQSVSPPVRIWNIQLQNFSIINNSANPLYGGIRLFSTLYSNVSEISIYGTIFGISAAAVWDFTINRCMVQSYAFGVCFGPTTTYSTCKEVYCSKLSTDIQDYVTPMISDNTVPAWKEENQTINDFTSAFLINSANVTLYNTIIESYQFVCLSSNPRIIFDSLYVEGVSRIISGNSTEVQGVTNYYIVIKGNRGGVYNNGTELYSYSAENCQIRVYDFFAGTCYEPDRNTSYNGIYYIFDIPNPIFNEKGFYSDEDSLGKSRINCNLLNKVYINRKSDGANTLNWGYNRYNAIPFSELIKRYNEVTVYGNGEVLEDIFIDRKNFKFVNNINSSLWLSHIITIKDTTLDFKNGLTTIRPNTGIVLNNCFDVIGNNIIKFSTNNPHFNYYFKAVAPSFIRCYFTAYNVSVKAKVISPDSKYPIYIEVYVNDDYTETLTNTIGTTSGRPIAPIEGFRYFDTQLNKPIWWTGSKWVDATGTDV